MVVNVQSVENFFPPAIVSTKSSSLVRDIDQPLKIENSVEVTATDKLVLVCPSHS